MHKLNLNPESESSYPLTIDRLAEMQDDLQVPLKVLAGMHPVGNCIVSGCEQKGDSGYAIMGDDDHPYEVYEVKSGSDAALYLVLTETATTATNSEGDTVMVRTKRYLEWTASKPESGLWAEYSTMPRLRLRKTAHPDAGWVQCDIGMFWYVGTGCSPLKVQRVDGRVHLWGKVLWTQYAVAVDKSTASRIFENSTLTNLLNGGGTLSDFVMRRNTTAIILPSGYRPDGDVLVPIRYNGAVDCAILASDGELVLKGDREVGDTLEIDTWLEV